MKITGGLFDNMVLQRDRQNLSQARFQGEGKHDGVLFARINNGKTLKVGTCKNGRFTGVLNGLRAGGPYEIELFIKDLHGKVLDKIKIRNVLVGDVWILGGQSNMQGIGYLKYAAKPKNKVRAFYMDDRWGTAKDPIHNLSQAVDQIHGHVARSALVGVGPGVGFGQEMLRRTGVPQGLIACAHGGTSMTQWNPALKRKGGLSLYGAMLRRFRKNGGKIAGVVWYQGCSEANEEHIHYTRRMQNLIKAMRHDFNDRFLPVTIVQIASFCGNGFNHHYWNSVQEQQRLLPKKINNLATVPAIDLSLDDCIHISGYDQHRLGQRLAQAMSVLRGEKNAGLPPIELQSITDTRDTKTGGRTICVKFRNVMGRLQAAGRPSGFCLTECNDVSKGIFRTDLEKDRAIIRVQFPTPPQFPAIHYGYGLAPYCNITDSADRSLPVFGPLSIRSMEGFGKFIDKWLVSRAMPSAGKLNKLNYPKNKKNLKLKARLFPGGSFCDLHHDLFAGAPDDALVYFYNKIYCRETMDLELCLGYDGPVKAWIDGRQMLHDPDGINPALADMAFIPWKAAPGNHELLIALGSNNGKAWGIFARFRRKDVSRRLMKLGPAYYSLPAVI